MPLTRFHRLAAAVFAALLALPAQALDPSTEGVARAEILTGWREADGRHMAALRIELAPGWKTYWRSPGDAGIPPRFGWEGTRNVASVQMIWPRPEVYEINGMRSIGYYNELVLPMAFTPERAGEPIELGGAVEIGVCREVCVPMTLTFSAMLPVAGGSDGRIAAALADRPMAAREAGVARVVCEVEPIRDGLRLTARIEMPAIGPDEVAVFELSDPRIWISEADDRREGGQLTAASDLVAPSGKPFALDRSDVRITVLGQGRAVEMQGCSGG